MAAALALLAGCSSVQPIQQPAPGPSHGPPNFALVAPGVYRGGQPSTDAQWQRLKALGIRWIVKLNTEIEGSDQAPAGVYVVTLPIPWENQTVARPSPAALRTAIRVMADSATNDAVYVHCEHGQDRTGLVCAMYRVLVQHWTPDQAEAEMLAMGFHKSLLGLWDSWKEFRASFEQSSGLHLPLCVHSRSLAVTFAAVPTAIAARTSRECAPGQSFVTVRLGIAQAGNVPVNLGGL